MTATITATEIDTKLAGLYERGAKLTASIRARLNTVHTLVGDVRRRTEAYKLTDQEAVAKLQEVGAENTYSAHRANEVLRELPILQRDLERVQAQKEILDGLYAEHRWTRAFIVSGGHVHSSMSCSSCYPTTQFSWLPELSGHDEGEIVELGGERACTICYASAPVETLSRPTQLFTRDEKAAQVEREVRAAAKAAKTAKIVRNTMVGLVDYQGYKITTLTAAKSDLTDCFYFPYKGQDEAYSRRLAEAIVAKLAENGEETTVDEQISAAKKRASRRP